MNIFIDEGRRLQVNCLELANSKSDYIVETFVDGNEYSAEFIVHNGQLQLIAIFRKYTHNLFKQQEIMHVLERYDDNVNKQLSDEINKVLKNVHAFSIIFSC